MRVARTYPTEAPGRTRQLRQVLARQGYRVGLGLGLGSGLGFGCKIRIRVIGSDRLRYSPGRRMKLEVSSLSSVQG